MKEPIEYVAAVPVDYPEKVSVRKRTVEGEVHTKTGNGVRIAEAILTGARETARKGNRPVWVEIV